MRNAFDRKKDREQETPGAPTGSNKLSNLLNKEKSVIAEATEAEENNTTQIKIGNFGKIGNHSSSQSLQSK